MDHSEDPEELHSYSMTGGVSAHQHLEIDGVISEDSPKRKVNHNWQLGRPWFLGASHSSSPKETNAVEEARYYGGIMKSESRGEKEMSIPTAKPQHPPKSRASFVSRQIRRMQTDEESSISKFKETDWTPPDSSYGAACPVCGWIPKHVRQKIELSLIVLAVLGFLWAVIATSIHVSNARKYAALHNKTGYDSLFLEDDFYVEFSSNSNDNVTYNTFSDDVYVVHDDLYYLDDQFGDDGAAFDDDQNGNNQ